VRLTGEKRAGARSTLHNTHNYSSNMGTWRWSAAAARRWRLVAPITAITVRDSKAVRGTKIRCVLERWSGGLTKYHSGIAWRRSEGMRPSRTSLSLKRRRTQRPSERGRVVNVLRASDSASPNSRTK